MIKHSKNRQPNRRQVIQTGIAGIAGAAAVGLTTQANALQSESTPKLVNPNSRFAGAEAALFLASNDCPYITGVSLLADGGMMSGL
ncbi:MAG: hypothetical protein ICV78_16760 [Tolypothrix sp. Co-bin9]|nr:hypothetical protein [Tolypothrix sp. Co-bin9]